MYLTSVLPFLCIGFATGILSGLFGIGGGWVLVPLLLLAGVKIHIAIGTSLAYIACVSLFGSYKHYKLKNIDFHTALFILLGSIPMVKAGVYVNKITEEGPLQLSFGILILVTAVFMAKKTMKVCAEENELTINSTNGQQPKQPTKKIPSILLGVCVGFLSGLFGVGGGFIMVPAMVLFLGMTIKLAAGTSLFVIVLSSIVGAVNHWMVGNIEPYTLVSLVIAGVIGVMVGIKMHRDMSRCAMNSVLTAILLIAGVFLIADVFV